MVKVFNIRKNMMGTVSFTAQFTGMKKPQEFIVYPDPAPNKILIQSDNRCGFIVGEKVQVAIAKAFMQLPLIHNYFDTIENIEELKTAIRGTAGKLVGNNGIVYTNNEGAAAV